MGRRVCVYGGGVGCKRSKIECGDVWGNVAYTRQLKAKGKAVKAPELSLYSQALGHGARPHLHIGTTSAIAEMLGFIVAALCWLQPGLPNVFDYVAPLWIRPKFQ